MVWLKNVVKTNKLAPVFEPTPFKVMDRRGTEIIVRNEETNAQYRRNVSHAIKAPSQQAEGKISTNEVDTKRVGENMDSVRMQRPKRNCVKPARFQG